VPHAGPGLTILPTHRTLCRFDEGQTDDFERRIAEDFVVEVLPFTPANKKKVKKEFLAASRKTPGGGRSSGLFRPAPGFLPADHETGLPGRGLREDLHPILRRLDVMILSRLVSKRSWDQARRTGSGKPHRIPPGPGRGHGAG